MDLTGLFEQLGAAWKQAEAAIVASPELAGVGVALALGAGAAILFLILAGVFRIGAGIRRMALASAIKRDTQIGARVLIAVGGGSRQRSVSAFMRVAIEAHLKDYMFGGPFRVIPYPGGLDG